MDELEKCDISSVIAALLLSVNLDSNSDVETKI